MGVLFTGFEQQLMHVHTVNSDIGLRLVALSELSALQRDV